MSSQSIDIARALDEILANEGWLRFQRIAVRVVRQTWPDLIASEPKKDLGADGVVPASLASDGAGKVLACSLTASYTKILADAQKIRRSYPDAKTLLFATPVAVSNQLSQSWKDALKEATGLELEVISREDLISRLEEPAFGSILGTEFGLRDTAASDADLKSKVEKAAAANIESWKADKELRSFPLIPLRLTLTDDTGKPGEPTSLDDVAARLLKNNRIVLDAPPGSGKTTTLIQLADRLMRLGAIPLLIHLPQWANSDKELFEFMAAALPAFVSEGMSASEISRTTLMLRPILLLNGWNEVTAVSQERIEERLRGIDRDLRHFGIILATRTRSLSPPFRKAETLGIQKLSRTEREHYLIQALGKNGKALAEQLSHDRALDELTRNPFILYWTMRLHKAHQTLPSTKMGILSAVAQLYEDDADHRAGVSKDPLNGYAAKHLINLSVAMTASGRTALSQAESRTICTSTVQRLFEDGQIFKQYNPSDVLAALCDHHLLRRLPGKDAVYEFAHQQFQEFYSALFLAQELEPIGNDSVKRMRFTQCYLNSPAWDQSCRMLAEEFGGRATEGHLSNHSDALVKMAAGVSPIFAASLAHALSSHLTSGVRKHLVDTITAWYDLGEANNRSCALAAMFASGFSEFSSLLIGLCTSEDQQIRLRTYRCATELYLDSFGPDWKNTVGGWDSGPKSDFISELTTTFGMLEVAEYFAARDQSVDIRKQAIRYLAWMGNHDRLRSALSQLPDAEIDDALLQLHREEIPAEFVERANRAQKQRASTIEDPVSRIRILLSRYADGDAEMANLIQDELRRVDGGAFPATAQTTLVEALDAVRKFDSQWVDRWLTQQIAAGKLYAPHWAGYISDIPQPMSDEAFQKVISTDLGHDQGRYIALLLTKPEVSMAKAAFNRYLELRLDLDSSKPHHTDSRWSIRRQIEELFRAMPAAVIVNALETYLSADPHLNTLRCIAEILSGVGRHESTEQRPLDMRPELPSSALESLRQYLKRGAKLAASLNELDGRLIAEIASALARVGKSEDLSDLNDLIRSDIARWHSIDEASQGGQRISRQGWSMWHITSLTRLAGDQAEEILTSLLTDIHYGNDSAKALQSIARVGINQSLFPNEISIYQRFWDARAQKAHPDYDDGKRKRYSAALQAAITELRREAPQNIHLLQALAAVLARLDGARHAGIICEIVEAPHRFGHWTRLEILRGLLSWGVAIPFTLLEKVLDDVFQEVRPKGYFNGGDQDRGLVRDILKLFPYSDDPKKGIAKIEEMFVEKVLYPYDIQSFVLSLGYSKHPDAFDLLMRDANGDAFGWKHQGAKWINVIGQLDPDKTFEFLLRFIDPDQTPPLGEMGLRHDLHEAVPKEVAKIAATNAVAQQKLLSLTDKTLSDVQKYMLMKSLAHLGTKEALMSAMSLYENGPASHIPSAIEDVIERQVLLRRQHEPSSNAYTLEPATAASLRKDLFERMIATPQLKWPIFALLGQIEEWRISHGKPIDEPRHPAFESGLPWPPLEFMSH